MVDPALHGLWGLVGVMAPWATPERLARMVRGAPADVRRGLHVLASAGLVAQAPHGDPHAGSWFSIRTPPRPDGALQRRLYHLAADVVPEDSNERLQHLVAAGRMDDLPAASLIVARARYVETGRPG